jgi:DNA repair exonuclease SbcCD ATPase subunit
MTINHKKVLLSLALSATLFAPSAFAQNNEEIIQSIMKLRADAESLYTSIDENKESYKYQMKSLAMQSADTEAQINRQETAIKLAENQLKEIESKIAAKTSSNTDLKPLLNDTMNQLEENIKSGFPFKVEERVAEITKIKEQLKEGTISEEKALSLVWANYDDSLRVTKEIGLFKHEINLNGKNILAKVAKIGSVMMFFSTPDDKVGYVTKEGSKYNYKIITDPKDVKNIVALFDALQKNIRTGYFTLPNALVLAEIK